MRQRSAIARAFVTDPAMLLDGRAVRRARRAEPRHPAGRAGADLGADRQDRDLRHPLDRGGAAAGRPHRHHDGAARPHQTDHRRAVPPSARPDAAFGVGRVRQAQARHLAGAGGRGERGRGRRWKNERALGQDAGAAALSDLADRAAAALAVAADGRHRRPPLHSGAERHRRAALGDGGERRARRCTRCVTLYRVFAGFFIGSIPGDRRRAC